MKKAPLTLVKLHLTHVFCNQKLITRFIDDKDGRRINLSLTSDGQDFLNKIAPDVDIVYKAIQKRYGEEKLSNLLDLLGEISEWRGR